MVDVFLVALSVSAVLLLSGCHRVDVPQDPGQALRDTSRPQGAFIARGADLHIVIDPMTGCEYIGYISHGLTPRLDSDGNPICVKPQSPTGVKK